jgi:hypothetical protein
MRLMTFTNLIIILCCFVVMSYSIKIIVNSYNPKAAVYVNMYSIYYIFLLSTLLFASACNSYIETMSAGSSSGVPSTKSPNNSLVENGVNPTANSTSSVSTSPVSTPTVSTPTVSTPTVSTPTVSTSPDTNLLQKQADAETEAKKLVDVAKEKLQDDVAEAKALKTQSDALTDQSTTIISPDNTLFKTNINEAQTKVTEAKTALKHAQAKVNDAQTKVTDAQEKVKEAQKALEEEAETKETDAQAASSQETSEEAKAVQTAALEQAKKSETEAKTKLAGAQAAQAAAQKALEKEEENLTNVVIQEANKIQDASKIQMTNPESPADKKLAEAIQQMQDAIKKGLSTTDIEPLRKQLTAAVEAVYAEKKEPESNPQDEFTKAFEKAIQTNKEEEEAQEVFLAAQEALKGAQGKTQDIITPILNAFSKAFHAAEKAAESNYNANKELNKLIKTKTEETPKEETPKETREQLQKKNDDAIKITDENDKLVENSQTLFNKLKEQNTILSTNLDHTDPSQKQNFNNALSKITELNNKLGENQKRINELDEELLKLFPDERNLSV